MTPPMPPTSTGPGPARREISRRWWTVIAGGWLAVILASLGYALADPAPTGRDQTTVAQARPVVDEAVARVATAAAGAGAIVAVSSFERVGSCDISLLREGERYRRTVVAVVAPGGEADLMGRVAAALPRSYGPVVRGGDQPRLTADAGYWVLLTGTLAAPGEVRFVADTGGVARVRFVECRPRGELDVTDPAPAVPTDVVPAVLARLDLSGGMDSVASVSCVEGGAVGTVEARAGAYAGDLRRALGQAPGAAVVVGEPRLFAYRTPTAQVAVRAYEDATIVTATTVCGS